ncbi:Alpha/Beta hydrolase protein [Thelonectria olida]|uniref:Alpha/Beta hydrolase protein n=1 Tax=Thelonectria olida TaxID=1576542 RepID=A0A9P9AKP1_9HYPO|nr:Alpha/Beta hydrolase protein [Thelonectria olida]
MYCFGFSSILSLNCGGFTSTTAWIFETHSFTIIFLHGRGSNARKFHAPLLESPLPSSSLTFREALPAVRFVFPTAPMSRALKYRRSVIHQWFDGSGDWEPECRGDMRPSIEHIRGILRDEVQRVGGDAKKVVLAGISQGCAMALMSLLLWEGDALGAVVVVCGFMPLVESMNDCFEEKSEDGVVFETDEDEDGGQDPKTPLQQAVDELCEEAELEPTRSPEKFPFLLTPVFMGHGTEDDRVAYRHGQQTARLLQRMGLEVDFHTYQGLGHWYSSEMLGHIVAFLNKNMA